MTQEAVRRRRTFDAEEQTLRRLARATKQGVPEKPLDALQQVTDMARDMTKSLYAALTVTGEGDNVEGFVVSGLTPEDERLLKAPPQAHGPLGTMRKDGRAVRIDELGEDATAFGFPPKHPEMKTLLGVPIWVGTTLRGALYVTDRDGGKPFRDRDETALRVLARHAGNIIETRWY